jgi:hypothetical protein
LQASAAARRAIVDQQHWISADAFNETFALWHFLPAPNIVNLSMVFSARLMALFAVGGALRRVRSDVCGMRTDRHASLCREPPDGAANLRAGQKSSRPRWFRSRSD